MVRVKGGEPKTTNFAIDINRAHNLWYYYQNIGKMLVVRGCDKDTVAEYTGMTFADFRQTVEENNMTIVPFTVENHVRKVLSHVTIYPLDKVDAKQIHAHIEKLLNTPNPEEYTHNIIFIATEKLVTKIRNIFAERSYTKEYGKIIFETFDTSFFAENKIENKMCIPHIEVTAEEKKKIMDDDPGIIFGDLPGLLTNDPMCMYYGFPVGTVVKTLQQDEDGQRSSYRIVTTYKGFTIRDQTPH